MKMLWIEDFGGNVQGSIIAKDMFCGLLSTRILEEEYDPDEVITFELPRLFEKHTTHRLDICRSYTDWR